MHRDIDQCTDRHPWHGIGGSTQITTPVGNVDVRNVRVGDRVWAYDERTRSTTMATVSQTVANMGSATVIEMRVQHATTIAVDIDVLFTAPSHSVKTDVGWLRADQLDIHHRLLSADVDVNVSIVAIRARHIADCTTDDCRAHHTLYNLEVAVHHTYYVTSIPFLVHNVILPDGTRYVYRAVNAREVETLDAGQRLSRSGSRLYSAQQHIANDPRDSGDISASKTLYGAAWHAIMAYQSEKKYREIVKIDLSKLRPRNVADVSGGTNGHGKPLTGIAQAYSTADLEVIMRGKIPQDAITRLGPLSKGTLGNYYVGKERVKSAARAARTGVSLYRSVWWKRRINESRTLSNRIENC